MGSEPANERLVGALARGIAVLRYLNSQDNAAGVNQIARDLNLNPSTCYNLLRTLVSEGLVAVDDQTKRYSPSLGVLALANGVLRKGGYPRLARSQLARISTEFSVTSMLWRLVSPSRVLLVELTEAPTPVRVHMTVGQRLPSLIGALGRCVAAHSGLPKKAVHAMFKDLRWQDPPTFQTYWAEVEMARRNGYSIDIGNFNRNFTTVAAPILESDGVARMAISAIAFSSDLDGARRRALALAVRDAAREVTHALGGADPATLNRLA
jgi:DNA-binding IclR family transcriptional regulator